MTIKNTRFDEDYRIAPGQWDAIYLLEGSTDNSIRYADITNGTIGLRVGVPDDDRDFDLTVENTTIGHMSVAGILAFTSDIYGANLLVYNCGDYLIGNFAGGTYQYDHCTFSNFPNLFSRDEASVQFSDNIIIDENQILAAPLDITLRNSIIWGTESDELLIAEGGGQPITRNMTGGIIKSSQLINNFFTSQESNYPGFLNPQLFDYHLDSLAFSIDKSDPIGITSDLEGNPRDVKPDFGAYEYIQE